MEERNILTIIKNKVTTIGIKSHAINLRLTLSRLVSSHLYEIIYWNYLQDSDMKMYDTFEPYKFLCFFFVFFFFINLNLRCFVNKFVPRFICTIILNTTFSEFKFYLNCPSFSKNKGKTDLNYISFGHK